jgi:hypothetical protein
VWRTALNLDNVSDRRRNAFCWWVAFSDLEAKGHHLQPHAPVDPVNTSVDSTTSGDVHLGSRPSQPDSMLSDGIITDANPCSTSNDRMTDKSFYTAPQDQKRSVIPQSSSLKSSASSCFQDIHSNNGGASQGVLNTPKDVDGSEPNDLSRRIPGMFRVLDLIGEQGSDGIGKCSSS